MRKRPNSAADCLNYMSKRLKLHSDKPVEEQKLHDLLYLALREGFAILQEPIFEGAFMSLPEGPYCMDLHAANISQRNLFHSGTALEKTIMLILNSVLEQYGSLSHSSLMSRIEKDLAWIKASTRERDARLIDPEELREDARKINLLKSLWCMDHNTFTDHEYGGDFAFAAA